jgi:hypothetical protein
MKIFSCVMLFIFSKSFSYGQKNDIKALVDSLQFIKADTFNCNADIYWRVVAQGRKAIPYLIEKLTDTTATNIKYRCKKTTLNVGEVAHFALEDIAYFPTALVTHIQFDLVDIKRCWNFYSDFLFINSKKTRYQKCVRDWYAAENKKYKAVKIPKIRQTTCQRKYGINTYYRWAE